MLSLVNESSTFKHIVCKNTTIFDPKIVRNFCSAKVPYIFSAKNMSILDGVCTRRLNESLPNDVL